MKYLLGKFSAFCQLAALYYPAQPLLLMDYSRSVRWDLKIGACCPVGSSEHFEEIRNSSNWRLGGLIWRQIGGCCRGQKCLETGGTTNPLKISAMHEEKIKSFQTFDQRIGRLVKPRQQNLSKNQETKSLQIEPF